MQNKPNQVVDEVMRLVYPPSEAIIPQLSTIRSIAASTIKVYDATHDIHSIFPNLNTLQEIINYLRGAPMKDELKPEDTLKPIFISSAPGLTITSSLNKDGEYDISIVGTNLEPKIDHPELFGDVNFKAIEMNIKIPVICGQTYLIAQSNPVLKNYLNDEYVMELDGEFIKEKMYNMIEDIFEYAFLLIEGRTKVNISIYADYQKPIVFNITSHIHFKKEKANNE